MVTKVLTYVEDDPNTGLDGWLMEGSPEGFDPTTSFGLVHDCIEHFYCETGLEDELLAFGAMLYIRGMYGNDYWSIRSARFTGMAQMMASDLSEFLLSYKDDLEISLKPASSKPLDDEDDEQVIRDLPRVIIQELKNNRRDECYHFRNLREVLRNVQHWVRKGYRKAAKRWKIDRHELPYYFHDIQKAIEALPEGYDGQQMLVQFSLSEYKYDVRLRYE